MAKPTRLPRKGSYLRPDGSGSYRSIVAVGGPVFTSIANAASSAAIVFTLSEPAILDRLTLMAGAATQLVAGADAALYGSYVTNLTLAGDALISGNVAAPIFDVRSTNSPRFGHKVIPGASVLSLVILNESGATAEYGCAFSVG